MLIRKKKKKFSLEILVEFALLVATVPILYQMFVIEETIREWINKPVQIVYTNVGYYKCGGTKKTPKVCPIILKEKFTEE